MRIRCLWQIWPLFRQHSEWIAACVCGDSGMIWRIRKQSVAFPQAQGPRANAQYLSRLLLPDAHSKPFLLEVFAEGCRFLGNWKTPSPNRRYILAGHVHTPVAKRQHRARGSLPLSIEEFLIDLCINPRVSFSLPGEKIDSSEFEAEWAIEKNPELERSEFRTAKLVYFQDIIVALLEYKRRHEANIRDGFQLTAIGKKIWETLDYALASRGMVVLDGLEGRGKTEAVKAWCDLHLGSARFVSLKGIAIKTVAFREISKALGIASSFTRKATEMQVRIEDVLKRSKLLLIIDEAHFLFNQSQRMSSRPELIDWIDTVLCNHGIGCALVTTPQFLICMTRAADQVEWNYRQFRRRVRRWVKLPQSNTEADIQAVARSVFPKAGEAVIKKIVGYALLSKRDVSAVGDVATELRVMNGKNDLSEVSAEQVNSAIFDFLLPSDKAFVEGMESCLPRSKKMQRREVAAIPHVPDSKEDEELPDTGASRAERANNFTGENRLKKTDLITL
jgi:hypothetical protein